MSFSHSNNLIDKITSTRKVILKTLTYDYVFVSAKQVVDIVGIIQTFFIKYLKEFVEFKSKHFFFEFYHDVSIYLNLNELFIFQLNWICISSWVSKCDRNKCYKSISKKVFKIQNYLNIQQDFEFKLFKKKKQTQHS